MRPCLSSAILLLALSAWAGQAVEHFYDVDTEVRVEGTVRDVVFERRYKGHTPFIILALEETATGQDFQIEIGPSWFFGEDVHVGEKVAIVGSLIRAEGDVKYVIARELRFRGETMIVRDRRGFPEWRGGGPSQRGRRRGKGY